MSSRSENKCRSGNSFFYGLSSYFQQILKGLIPYDHLIMLLEISLSGSLAVQLYRVFSQDIAYSGKFKVGAALPL